MRRRVIAAATAWLVAGCANHHLIASSSAIRETLERIRPGHRVLLEGQLVDVDVAGHVMRTSLSRTDKGDGACEVLFVTRAQIFE